MGEKKETTLVTVSIPLEKLEELLDIETRVNVLVSEMRSAEQISKENVFRTLGYIKDANEEHLKTEHLLKRYTDDISIKF